LFDSVDLFSGFVIDVMFLTVEEILINHSSSLDLTLDSVSLKILLKSSTSPSEFQKACKPS